MNKKSKQQGGGHVMTRIAHLSDIHMLERSPGYGLSVHWLSAGRRLDAASRIKKLLRGFEAARRAGSTHYVLSGDLTESGTPAQFEQFAETLHESGIDPERVTLVPGNHDAYGEAGEWTRAIEGPLRAYARTSCGEQGKVVDIGSDVCLLPMDVTFRQPVTRSAGIMTEENCGAFERRAKDTGLRKKTVVAVTHHPPYKHTIPMWQWIDGMSGGERMMEVLARTDHVHVLHGHLHKATTKDRIFGATATVEDDDTARVRLYEARAGMLESVGLA